MPKWPTTIALRGTGDEGVDASERCVHEKPGRGGRPHVLAASGKAVPDAAGLSGKQACRGGIADMMRGMAGCYERRDAVRGKALRRDEALRWHGIERTVPVGHGTQDAPGALPQLDRVNQMGDALFVADDAGLGEPGGDLADCTGVVEVNVGQKNVVQPRDPEGVERGEQLTGGGGGADIHEKRRLPPDEPGADEIGETVQGRGEGDHEDMITEGSNVCPHKKYLSGGGGSRVRGSGKNHISEVKAPASNGNINCSNFVPEISDLVRACPGWGSAAGEINPGRSLLVFRGRSGRKTRWSVSPRLMILPKSSMFFVLTIRLTLFMKAVMLSIVRWRLVIMATKMLRRTDIPRRSR